MTTSQYIDGVGPATVEFIGPVSVPAGSSNSFSMPGVPIGSAAIRRRIFLNLAWTTGDLSDCPVQSATINGEPCIVHVDHRRAANNIRTAILSARVDIGTTATIDITYTAGGPNYSMGMAVSKVMNLRSPVAYDTKSTDVTSVGSASLFPNVKKDGIVLMGVALVSGNTFSFVGVTENYETAFSGSFTKILGGSFATTADETGRTLTIQRDDPGGPTFSGALVAASFR